MKKVKQLLVPFLFLFGILFLSSCYTKKQGIVPCPHGYNDVNIENVDVIPSEKV